jgi:hypothetical protein
MQVFSDVMLSGDTFIKSRGYFAGSEGKKMIG